VPQRLFLHDEIGTVENPAVFAAAEPDSSLEVTAVHGTPVSELSDEEAK
jgi:peptide/nickel transport system ATP-binding protein